MKASSLLAAVLQSYSRSPTLAWRSNFAHMPLDRLRTTMTLCLLHSLWNTIINMVHRAHEPIKDAGYTADDVDLRLWVAATLYAAGVNI